MHTNLEQYRFCHEEQCCHGLFNVEIIALLLTHLSIFLMEICSASISLLWMLQSLSPGFSFNSLIPKACICAEAFSSHPPRRLYHNLCWVVSLACGSQAAFISMMPTLHRGKRHGRYTLPVLTAFAAPLIPAQAMSFTIQVQPLGSPLSAQTHHETVQCAWILRQKLWLDTSPLLMAVQSSPPPHHHLEDVYVHCSLPRKNLLSVLLFASSL